MHKRFKFPEEYDNLTYPKNLVNNHASNKFSKNLGAWRSMAKKKFFHKEFSEVHME